MVKLARLTVVVFGVLGLFWTWESRPAVTSPLSLAQASTRIGAPAPPFELISPAKNMTSLDGLKGKVVILNFWASWCLPCRAEMAALNQVNLEYGNRNVIVLGVNLMESEDVAIGFMKDQHLEFVLALDADGHVSQQYRVMALPTTYFIDRTGVIRDIVYGGPMTRPLIESKINAMLEQ